MRSRGRGKEPRCPFCGELFDRPEDIRAKLGNVFSGGRCKCGAVYVFDRTERSLGEAYVDAIVFACNDDWDTAWKLTPEIDYKIESFYYDREGHQLMDRLGRGGRVKENLLFVSVKTDKCMGHKNQ